MAGITRNMMIPTNKLRVSRKEKTIMVDLYILIWSIALVLLVPLMFIQAILFIWEVLGKRLVIRAMRGLPKTTPRFNDVVKGIAAVSFLLCAWCSKQIMRPLDYVATKIMKAIERRRDE